MPSAVCHSHGPKGQLFLMLPAFSPILPFALSGIMLSLSELSLPLPPAIAVAALVALLVLKAASSRRSNASPKGTRKVHALTTSHPLLGDTPEMVKHVDEMHDWLTRLCKQHQGQPFMLNLVGVPRITVLATPGAYEDVLKTHFDIFVKGQNVLDAARDFIGDGIFNVNHDKWAFQRKIATNLFTMRALRDSMTEIIRHHTITLFEVLEKAGNTGQTLDLYKLFNRFTMEAFAEMGFGIQMNCIRDDREHAFQAAFDDIQHTIRLRVLRPSWFWRTQKLLGLGEEGVLKRNLEVLNTLIYDMLSQSLEQRAKANQTKFEKPKVTLVSLFLDSADADDKVDAKFLRDMVVNFLIAGRDTTALTLSWLFYNLDQHPDVVRKVREEIAAKVPELASGEIRVPTMEQIESLVYLEAVLKETLRLHPPVPVNSKQATKDVVLSDGTFIPAKTMVNMSSYAMARMKHVWGPDAAEFNPDRWIDPVTGKLITVSTFKFPVFLAGPRICLGMNLAMLEMKLVVAGLLSHFETSLVPDQHVTYGISFTLPVKGGLLAKVLPKTAST